MKKTLTIIFLLATILVACKRGVPTPTEVPAIETPTNPPEPTLASRTATLTATATATPSPTATPAPAGYGPDNFPVGINPLTGLQVADPKLLDRRPVSIKVNIVPRYSNRPPWGLSFADIVYEYYHNSGYARYHAIYYGQNPELVGPIRSGRLPDDQLVQMYKSVFVYGGADSRIDSVFYSSNYSNRLVREGETIVCPPTAVNPLCRYEPKKGDFLLGSMQLISQYITNKGVDNSRQNLNGMFFHPTTPSGGKQGVQLFVRFSSDHYNRWDYDANSSSYLLFQDNAQDQGLGEQFAPLTDRLTDQQISAENVVIVIAPHHNTIQPPSEIIDIPLNGSGPAYAFRDGRLYEVVWNRPATASVLFLTYPDGTPFPFKPGNTFFQIVGQSSVIKQQEDGSWRFEFKFP